MCPALTLAHASSSDYVSDFIAELQIKNNIPSNSLHMSETLTLLVRGPTLYVRIWRL